VSYQALGDGDLAAIVTYLEMTEQPAVAVPPSVLSLQRLPSPELDEYRELFQLVGAPWLWFSRLVLKDRALAAIVNDPAVELSRVVDDRGRVVGMLELDFREPGACELAFVGLVPELSGQGHGRWLLAEAVRQAWRQGISRVHVHTCSLDHPAALAAYCRAGFTPCKRAIERFPDPRLLGFLPLDCAPQIPVLGTPAPASPPTR
jgi:GNAT superfamily N-acetyltransferase